MKHTKSAMAIAMGLFLSGVGAVQADDMVNNYVRSSNGAVVTDSSGKCVRSTDKSDIMLEECGYEVEVVVEKEVEAVVVEVIEKDTVLVKVVIPNLQFAFDSAALSDKDMAILADAVEQLTPWKEAIRAQTGHVEINGYTDTSGSEAYNLKLSERRANTVADHLANELGVDRSRMQVTGMGEANPVADNATRAGRIQNRRVEVNVIQN